MSKAQELSSCPFCGREAMMSHSRDGEVCNVRCAGWSVGNCLGAGPNCYTEAEAITAWNRRTPASSEQQAAQQDERNDALQDSAYAAGMLSGWNLCVADDHATFSRIRGERMTGAARVALAARASNGGKE